MIDTLKYYGGDRGIRYDNRILSRKNEAQSDIPLCQGSVSCGKGSLDHCRYTGFHLRLLYLLKKNPLRHVMAIYVTVTDIR